MGLLDNLLKGRPHQIPDGFKQRIDQALENATQVVKAAALDEDAKKMALSLVEDPKFVDFMACAVGISFPALQSDAKTEIVKVLPSIIGAGITRLKETGLLDLPHAARDEVWRANLIRHILSSDPVEFKDPARREWLDKTISEF